MSDPRIVRPVLPKSVLFSAVAIGLAVLAAVFYAVWYTSHEIETARLTGVIVKKEFDPAPEEQVSLSNKGDLAARHKEGDYILTVEVPQSDGTKKPYYVWVNKIRYDSAKVGDRFDVGPALVHE